MDCLGPEEIADFLDGQLAAPAMEAAERHLDDCPDCRELVAELIRSEGSGENAPRGSVESLAEPPVNDTLVDRLMGSGSRDAGAEPDPSLVQSLVDEAPGRYHTLGERGFGGQARVLSVYDTFNRREVALKELTPSPDGRDGGRTLRFIREARLSGQLNHPTIVHIHEIGRRPDGRLYYTMPMVRGITLTRAIAERTRLDERLVLLERFVDLCDGIAYAHSRGVIHRDLKPENVMLGEFGETVILDWGLAKVRDVPEAPRSVETHVPLLEHEGLTADGVAVGTPAYMSPEQANARLDEVDEQSDVWGLGAVLHEMLTGRPPFTADTAAAVLRKAMTETVPPVRETAPEVPPALAAIADRALQRDRAARYPDVNALAADLRAYLSGRRVTSYVYSSWELFRLFARRNRAALAMALLVLVGVVVGLVGLLVAYQRERRARATVDQALSRVDAARAKERQERLAAQLHLAQAFLVKADREAREKDYLSAEVYAAASLLHNPGHAGSRQYDSAFARRYPLAGQLAARAASKLRLSRFSEITGRRYAVRLGFSVYDVAFAPDGKRLAVAGDDGRVRLMDAGTGKVQRVLEGHGKSVGALAWSPDGALLASAGRDFTLRLWRAGDGKQLRVFRGHTRAIYGLDFAPDGQRIVSSSMDGHVGLWHVDGTRKLWIAAHRGEVKDVAFSPDGKQLASAGSDRVVRLWSAADGRPLGTIDGYHGAVTKLAYSPDGRHLATVSRDATVRIHELATRRLLFVFREKDAGYLDTTFWPQRRRLLAAQTDGVIRVFDDTSGRLRTSVRAHAGLVTSIAVSPDGARVASTGQDGFLKLWSMTRQRSSPAQLVGHRELVFGVAFSPDGERLVSGSLDGTVRLWRTADGALLHALGDHSQEVTKVAFSPDGARFASASKDGSVILWDAATGRRLHRLTDHTALVYGVTFSPDGKQLATGALDGTIRLWDVATGRARRVLKATGHMVYQVTFSPDGRQLAAGSGKRAVTLWDVATGGALRTLKGHDEYVTGVDYLGPGQLVTGGKNGKVLLWDLATGTVRRTVSGHSAWVNAVRSSPDGRLVATAADDRTVRIWSVATWRPVMIIDTSTVAVSVAFSPKGDRVAVGDGLVVRLYPIVDLRQRLDPERLLERAERAAGLKLDGFLGRPIP